uniref:Uncharacterized protein n=1 Tax=Glossina morsitans morsitans TaxID=37546 RepID=A0ABK9NG32_GLOMM
MAINSTSGVMGHSIELDGIDADMAINTPSPMRFNRSLLKTWKELWKSSDECISGFKQVSVKAKQKNSVLTEFRKVDSFLCFLPMFQVPVLT